MGWGSEVEIERRNRIRLSVAAWVYEKHSDEIMSDAEFDALCLKIRPEMATGNKKLDRFFKTKFSTHTGQWVQSHPDKNGLEAVYQRYYK